MYSEVESLKNITKRVKAVPERNDRRLSQVELKVNDLERYHRRWNLRLHGVPEQKQEDITTKVLDICCVVTGETSTCLKGCVDVTHRLGRYQDNQGKPRSIIIWFPNRSARELVWRKAKSNTFLKDNHLRFTEDLSADNRKTLAYYRQSKERRKKLTLQGSG